MSEVREERRRALAEARAKLNKRKAERQRLKEQRNDTGSAVATSARSDRGQTLIQETRDMIQEKKEKATERPDESATAMRMPGRRVELTVATNVSTCDITASERERYDKAVFVDMMELATTADILKPETTDAELNQIKVEFMSNEVDVWPPKEIAIQTDDIKDDGDDNLDESDLYDEKEMPDEDEEEPKLLSLVEYEQLMGQPDVYDAFITKSMWMERALAVNRAHKVFFEGNVATIATTEENDFDKIQLKNNFRSDDTAHRAVTSVDFSHINGDWFLASYAPPNSEETFSDVPDGCVNIWSLLLPERPEYTLETQSMITVARFHPTNPTLVIGCTITGQVVAWDMRTKKTPISRTQFMGKGHSMPVFGMEFLPTAQSRAQHILSVSNDAQICMWRDDLLVETVASFRVEFQNGAARTEDVSPTCFSLPPKDPNNLVLGCDEGTIYKGEIHGQWDEKKPQHLKEQIVAHSGPVSAVHFHPAPPGRRVGGNVANLFLSCSYDWSVKLWHLKYNQPLATFEHTADYIYDVKWSPVHPSVFACCDGIGKVSIFDLNVSMEVPVVDQIVSEVAADHIAWARDGKSIVVGDSDGSLYHYDVHPSLYETTDDAFDNLENLVERKLARDFEI